MIWIIAVTVILINEFAGDERWNVNAAAVFATIGLLMILAYKNPGETILFAIIGLAAFVGWELYLNDIRRNKKSRG